MKKLYYQIKNALVLFVWGFKNYRAVTPGNFRMLSDLLVLLLKVAQENRPCVSKIASVHPETGENFAIVSIWAGAGIGAEPLDRLAELAKENSLLKVELSEALSKNMVLNAMGKINTADVTRFEVINHTKGGRHPEGRMFVFSPGEFKNVELSLQDNNRTLKIFVS